MIVYSRFVAKEALEEFPNALEETKAHVIAHLSSVVDTDDDPETNVDNIKVVVYPLENGYYVHGQINAEPTAPYLRSDYDPDKEATEGR